MWTERPGGVAFFERLIQNTKRCLRKTLRNAKLNYDELHTVLVEVEGTLNSRLLTYVSSNDPEEPLTPSHLMYGRRILSLPEVTGNRQASLDHTVSSEDPKKTEVLGIVTGTLLEALEQRICYRVKEPASAEIQA